MPQIAIIWCDDVERLYVRKWVLRRHIYKGILQSLRDIQEGHGVREIGQQGQHEKVEYIRGGTLNRISERILPAPVLRILPASVLRVPRSLLERSGNPPEAGRGEGSMPCQERR